MVLGFCDRITVPASINESQRFGFVVCGMFCALAAGAIYAFSLISGKMTDDYKFSQNDITTVSTVGMVFGYFTLPFGFIYDYIGPKPIFVIGIVAFSLGATLFALTFDDTIGHSVASLSVINAIMNIGCGMFDMGAILSILSWFPIDRGLLVAATKTMTGLAGSVIATVYNTYFSGKHTEYMFFLVSMVAVIGIVSFIYIQIPPFHMTGYRLKHYTEEEYALARRVEHMYLVKKAPRRRFLVLFVIVISLLIVITTQSIVFVFEDDEVPFYKRNPPAIVMIVLYFSLIIAVLPLPWLDGPTKEEEPNREPVELSGNMSDGGGNAVVDAADGSKNVNEEEQLYHNDDRNFPQYRTGFFHNVLHNIPLWCVWINAVIVAGGVHIVLLNSRQLYVAVSENTEDEQRPSLYVALTSVGNAIGRLAVSFYEAWNASRPLEKRTSITVTYCIPSLLIGLSCIFFLVVPANALIVPMLLAGLANGTYAASLVLTVRTIFSIDVAKHYNSIFFFDLIGVIFFNRLLFGEIMTRNSEIGPEGQPQCLGRDKCLRTTFIVMGCLSAFAFVASVTMHILYMRFVRDKWDENSRQRDEEQMEDHESFLDSTD